LDSAGGIGGIAEVEEELEKPAELAAAEVEIAFFFNGVRDSEADNQNCRQEEENDEQVPEVKAPDNDSRNDHKPPPLTICEALQLWEVSPLEVAILPGIFGSVQRKIGGLIGRTST
jgi:hypothetical protein